MSQQFHISMFVGGYKIYSIYISPGELPSLPLLPSSGLGPASSRGKTEHFCLKRKLRQNKTTDPKRDIRRRKKGLLSGCSQLSFRRNKSGSNEIYSIKIGGGFFYLMVVEAVEVEQV